MRAPQVYSRFLNSLCAFLFCKVRLVTGGSPGLVLGTSSDPARPFGERAPPAAAAADVDATAGACCWSCCSSSSSSIDESGEAALRLDVAGAIVELLLLRGTSEQEGGQGVAFPALDREQVTVTRDEEGVELVCRLPLIVVW